MPNPCSFPSIAATVVGVNPVAEEITAIELNGVLRKWSWMSSDERAERR